MSDESPWDPLEDRAVREQIAGYRARAEACRASRTYADLQSAAFYDQLADAAEALEHMRRMAYGGR